MSIPVDLPTLADVMARYAFAYLLTNPGEGAPHAVAVLPRLAHGRLVLDSVGRRTRTNLAAHPEVAIVWPPTSLADYSLIVDGRATLIGEDSVSITPGRAVLHRPAERSAAVTVGACGSDCVELPVTAA